MIQINNLSKTLGGKPILENISLTIPKGSIYGIIGMNGAGKTTLIRHMIGAYQGDEGIVLIDQEDVYTSMEAKRKIAFIPDEFPDIFGDKVNDVVELYIALYPDFDKERYHQLMEKFHRDGQGTIRHFSKGMKKQILFALALASKPQYLIMDEPFDGLDPQVKKEIWDVLIEDVTERKMTIFISSHHLSELDSMCDHVAFVHLGNVLFEDGLEKIKEQYSKIQIVFENSQNYYDLETMMNVLHHDAIGRIHTFVFENNQTEITKYVLDKNPTVFEFVPLSLEEIFLYTLGGKEDAIKEVAYPYTTY